MAKTFADVEESAASPSRESIGTSVEVQTGNSSHIFSIKEESDCTRHPIRRRSGAQVLKIQVGIQRITSNLSLFIYFINLTTFFLFNEK